MSCPFAQYSDIFGKPNTDFIQLDYLILQYMM